MEPSGITKTQILKDPVVADEVWQAMKDVSKSRQLAVVFRPTENESEIVVDQTFGWEASGMWVKLEQHLTAIDQDIRWAAINMPYLTTSGGKRNKLMFLTWVPDTLTRPKMRESVRVKFNGIQYGGPMRKQAATDGGTLYQANDASDITLDAVLEKAAKFERDGIDRDSLAQLL